MNIDIFPVPVFEGCNIKGVDQAPEVLLKAGAADLFKKHHSVNVFEEVKFVDVPVEKMFNTDSEVKYKGLINKMTNDVCDLVSTSIKNGNFPITFGGDHSIGTGSIAGNSVAGNGNVAAIWFDAHPDINTPESSPSKNFHGMSFGTAMGFGDQLIANVAFDGAKVDVNNCYLIGVRSIDEGEEKKIRDMNIFTLKSSDVNNISVEKAAKLVIEDLEKKGMPSVHFSIDVDVVTPEDMLAVNVPEPNGISIDDAITFIKIITAYPKVKSIDFVEYNPFLDADKKSLHNCLRMLEAISETLAKR